MTGPPHSFAVRQVKLLAASAITRLSLAAFPSPESELLAHVAAVSCEIARSITAGLPRQPPVAAIET